MYRRHSTKRRVPKYIKNMMECLESLTPRCGFQWSAGYSELLYQVIRPATYVVPYWDYRFNENGEQRSRSEYFDRLSREQKVTNIFQTYKNRCCWSETDLAKKLRMCDWITEQDEYDQSYQVSYQQHQRCHHQCHHRCHHARICPLCLFIERAVPLYMGVLRAINYNPDLRIYHLRFGSRYRATNVSDAHTVKEINFAVKHLSQLREQLQDTSIARCCVKRWTGISLLGSNVKKLHVSLDMLCVADQSLLPKLEKVVRRFTQYRCTFLYCYLGTRFNIQRRVGSFLQYPAWLLTTPLSEIEDYFLDVDVFRTRLSSF